MPIKVNTPNDYAAAVQPDRREAFIKLRETVLKNLPKGFEEGMANGMIGIYVPFELYPAGYHCEPKQPLPFIGLANQKSHIGLYHMGIYAHPVLLKWFTEEYPKYSKKKLDMGKSCIRFKKPEDIPYKLIGELMKKMTVKEWIEVYESNFKPAMKKR